MLPRKRALARLLATLKNSFLAKLLEGKVTASINRPLSLHCCTSVLCIDNACRLEHRGRHGDVYISAVINLRSEALSNPLSPSLPPLETENLALAQTTGKRHESEKELLLDGPMVTARARYHKLLCRTGGLTGKKTFAAPPRINKKQLTSAFSTSESRVEAAFAHSYSGYPDLRPPP